MVSLSPTRHHIGSTNSAVNQTINRSTSTHVPDLLTSFRPHELAREPGESHDEKGSQARPRQLVGTLLFMSSAWYILLSLVN